MAILDPVGDLLTRIRNATMAKSDDVEMPASRLRANVVKVLREEGLIESFKLQKEEGKALIRVKLKYDAKGNSVIKGLKRVSRPGLRKYVGSTDVAKVKSGSGIAILSTSKGVMTNRAARQAKVGGEFLCEIW